MIEGYRLNIRGDIVRSKPPKQGSGVPSERNYDIMDELREPSLFVHPTKPLNKPTKQKVAEVVAERVVVDNRKMIKIIEFRNVVEYGALPKKYRCGYPRFSTSTMFPHLTIISENHKIHHVKSGDILCQTEFNQLINTMKKAEVRLTEINKKAKLEKEYSGKFTVNI